MTSHRAGMRPHLLPRGAGWIWPVSCAGLFLALQIAFWITGGKAVDAQAQAATLEQQIRSLPPVNGQTWRELEQARLNDRERQTQTLRTRFERAEPEELSWLALRQKQDDLEKILRAKAQEVKVSLPERFELPHGTDKEDGGSGEEAALALQASELAAEGALLWLQQQGITVDVLHAGVEGDAVFARIEGVIPGQALSSFLTDLRDSNLTPRKIEIKRGDGISPTLRLVLELVCPELSDAGTKKAAP